MARTMIGKLFPNDLLRFLLDRVEVHRFVEKVPSMNDIFIQQITDARAKATAANPVKTAISEA